jgi:hypothetical protein
MDAVRIRTLVQLSSGLSSVLLSGLSDLALSELPLRSSVLKTVLMWA